MQGNNYFLNPSSDGQYKIPDQQTAWDLEYSLKKEIWGLSPLEETAYTGTGVFLDLGCGNGKNLKRTGQGRSQIIGLDFSREALLLCRRNPDLSGIDLVCADTRFLPFKEGRIHELDVHHLISHLAEDDRIRAAQEIKRVLTPDGEVVITVFGTGDLRYGKGTEIKPGTFVKGTGILTHFFTERELSDLFSPFQCISAQILEWPMRVRANIYMRQLLVSRFKKG